MPKAALAALLLALAPLAACAPATPAGTAAQPAGGLLERGARLAEGMDRAQVQAIMGVAPRQRSDASDGSGRWTYVDDAALRGTEALGTLAGIVGGRAGTVARTGARVARAGARPAQVVVDFRPGGRVRTVTLTR